MPEHQENYQRGRAAGERARKMSNEDRADRETVAKAVLKATTGKDAGAWPQGYLDALAEDDQ